jgi:hypothetical protein
MNCLEFRRAAGADPQHLASDALEHARSCAACARYLAEIRELDARIARALAVPVPDAGGRRGRLPERPGRRRVLAIAASLLLAIGAGMAGWVFFPRESLASAVVDHMSEEPQAWMPHPPVADAVLEAVLKRSGARFSAAPGRLTYVQSCWFRGRYVPHLVLETGAARVTLMLLRHERVTGPTEFNERGYRGVLLPVGRGSVAVLTQGVPLPANLAERIAGSIEWTP